MRRQDQYLNSGADAYAAAQMQQAQQLEREHALAQFHGQLEAFTPERDDPYVTSKVDGQQGWDRDGPATTNSMASQMFYEGQGGDVSRLYYQRPDPRQTLEKQADSNARSQSRDKEMDAGHEKMRQPQTFEGLEQKFVDDMMKLSKDLHDAEDAENARHREKLKSIDTQYQKQLETLRSRHASRRDEFLRKESTARQHQYQQTLMDLQYQNTGMASRDPQGYSNITGPASARDPHRPYNNVDRYDSYEDHARYPGGGGRDQFEPRGQFPGGRSYDPSSGFY